MNTYKININTAIVLITSVLALYVFSIKDSSSNSTSSSEIFHYKSKQNTYMLRTGKTINIRFNFTWNICDINKLPDIPQQIRQRTWEQRALSILQGEIRHRAALSISFSKLNTAKIKKLIISQSNEIIEKHGICINSLKLHEVNGV